MSAVCPGAVGIKDGRGYGPYDTGYFRRNNRDLPRPFGPRCERLTHEYDFQPNANGDYLPPLPPRKKVGMSSSISKAFGLDASALGGVLAAATGLDAEIDGFLLRTPAPTSSEVVSFLQLYSGAARDEAARGLIAHGVPAAAVSGALQWLDTASKIKPETIKGVLTLTAAALDAYHGYRRNNSIAWGVFWFAAGTIFPIFTTAIAVAQGFGKEKK